MFILDKYVASRVPSSRDKHHLLNDHVANLAKQTKHTREPQFVQNAEYIYSFVLAPSIKMSIVPSAIRFIESR